MEPPASTQGPIHVEPNMPTESDTFATLHHLVSRIDAEDRMQEVIEKARGLKPEDMQLLVNCLSMALDKNAAPLKARTFVWRSLIKIASSAKIFSQNHTLRSSHIGGEPSTRIKVLKQPKSDDRALYNKSLTSWVHLSHPNVTPLYATFLNDEIYPSFVSPCLAWGNICDYVREHPEVARLPLVSDVVNGLFHLHQLGIVHGRLNPHGVSVSDVGRALITNLGVSHETQDFGLTPIRYSAPELLGEDDQIQPTKATDMWALACLCYEMLSGKVPFFQIANEFRVVGAVSQGSKPIRPGQEGVAGYEIDDTIWQLLMMCWKSEPAERPFCLKVHQIFLGMGIQDGRPEPRVLVGSDAIKDSTINPNVARTVLKGVLGSEYASSLHVPEHLRNSLFKLFPDTAKFDAMVTAAVKLNPSDMQCLVNFLDLVLQDLADIEQSSRWASRALLSKIMISTHIIPQHYKLNGVQYDSQMTVAEGSFGKACKGRGLNIRVSVVSKSSVSRAFLRPMSAWSQSSHPNIIPFYGVFHEGANESPCLCVVTPLLENGNLRDYAPTFPQKARMLLIFDVICGLNYLHEQLSICYGSQPFTPEKVRISDEGRAVIMAFETPRIFGEVGEGVSTYELRFAAPDFTSLVLDDIWSFGCLCYEVLSRKPPYYQYREEAEIRSAVSGGELPKRPDKPQDDVDQIDNESWDLITKCCVQKFWSRYSGPQIQRLMEMMKMDDGRPKAKSLPGTDILALRSRPDVDFSHVETLLGNIQVELLRSPLLKLVESRIKDVAEAAVELKYNDVQTLVDFLDLALKDHLTISDERNRVLALLSKITSSTRIFPQRYEVKGINYRSIPIAEGGFGTVHEGLDLNMCVKVMSRVEPKAFTEWIKELILWANSSHPNVLPFYGVFLEGVGDSQRICLVSPFMKNGNLHDYAPRLPPKSRLPLILDVINGLYYLHGLGIVHSDLKGQNVLISDEGRGFITDFGASHIVTATAAATTSSVFSTLRFAAPELMQDGAQPSKECDVWSFGCLCYQVLSRKVPYYQYTRDFQVAAALSRKELPKRPSHDETGEDDWDEDDDEDWDPIDDPAWNLISKCCAPLPEDRLQIPAIKELVADMKVWDDRPTVKAIPGAEIFKLRLNPEIDLNRAGEILDKLQMVVAPSALGSNRDFVDLYNKLV
ncbi:hypothetical protein D9756_002614 [Leucocoprinus leucothites]|uniref:Protein kinase domain-containing protein n=1 Tax=Leucocoprinus leucothites TaxID=201217 RepID=A0A8H5LLT9_9AGAR|nr:hypothetical protein D9756_002614 [Leucoagaricus leucothites]